MRDSEFITFMRKFRQDEKSQWRFGVDVSKRMVVIPGIAAWWIEEYGPRDILVMDPTTGEMCLGEEWWADAG